MRKGCWIALGGLGAFAVGSVYMLVRVVTQYYDFGAAASELPAAVAAYRADGLPFVAADVAPPRLKPEENPAAAIRRAAKILKGVKPDIGTALKRVGPGSDAVLAAYRPALAQVEAVADRPRVDFGRDWDLGPAVLFPEYADLKRLSKVAVLRAVRQAQKGDDVAALRSLGLARRLGLWSEQEPTLISMLVRLAIEAIVYDGVERCVVEAAGDARRIARYRGWLTQAPAPPSFGNALRGEMFMGVTTTRNLTGDLAGQMMRDPSGGTLATPTDPAKLRRDGVPDDAKARAFLARHLQTWHEAYRSTDGFRQSPKAIGDRLDRIAARVEGEKGLSYLVERIMLPVFSQAGEAFTTLEARRAVQRGFAEAMAYRAVHGSWPKTVSPKDPFTGKPLRIKVGKDFRVYSIGRDGTDDGGVLRREAARLGKKGDDLAAVYPPVPR